MFCISIKNWRKGFSFIEVLVGSAIFLIVAIGVYGSFTSLAKLANGSQARNLAVQLAAEQLEIVRNMPYSQVGLTTGIPLGVLPRDQILSRGGVTFNVRLTIRNINLSTSTVEASDKLVGVDVDCPACQDFQQVSLSGQISPANLATAGSGGALVVKVFDANGNPVADADVDVQSVATSTIQNHDTTNLQGVLNIIGVPPGNNMYRVIVSKTGYSTDQTFPLGAVDNPNPTRPNVTVLNQAISQISFAIDKLSTLNISSVTPLCAPVANVHFSMVGAKNIGAGIPKYSNALQTNGSGTYSSSTMEWDTYTVTPTDNTYDVMGINPDSPFSLNPGNFQNLQLVVLPKSPRSLMVSVVDSGTKLPISDVTVHLTNVDGYDKTIITGQGYLSQDDWSDGQGQIDFINARQYFAGNGFVDTATSSGDIVLKEVLGSYDITATGTLESSTFDTGTSSNFYTLSWTPANQPPLAGAVSTKLQFASNASSTDTSWSYFGPDGTANTFYTVPGSPINAVHNGNEYVRYKTYLTTETSTVTPKISNVLFSYTSACIPPGQVIFQGLSSGDYTLVVSKAGYTASTETINIVSDWQKKDVLLGI